MFCWFLLHLSHIQILSSHLEHLKVSCVYFLLKKSKNIWKRASIDSYSSVRRHYYFRVFIFYLHFRFNHYMYHTNHSSICQSFSASNLSIPIFNFFTAWDSMSGKQGNIEMFITDNWRNL